MWSRKFGEYQEQSYLLDPYLESLVSPVAECLRKYALTCVNARVAQSSHSRVERLSDLLHNYIKFRGYKTISRWYFLIYPPYIHYKQLDSSLMKFPISQSPWISFGYRQGQ
jgi:hypothetical protein